MAGLFRRVRVDQPMPETSSYLITPDGRYFIVRGRLWRMSNPALTPEVKQHWVDKLMQARRKVGMALKAHDSEDEKAARASVDKAKRALGERGPVWWSDNAPDFNRRLVKNSPYAEWYASSLSASVVATAHSLNDPD